MSCPSSSYDWIRMGTMAGVAENCAEKLSLPEPPFPVRFYRTRTREGADASVKKIPRNSTS